MSHISVLQTKIIKPRTDILHLAGQLMTTHLDLFKELSIMNNGSITFKHDISGRRFFAQVRNNKLEIIGDLWGTGLTQQQLAEYIEQWYYTASSVKAFEEMGAETINVKVEMENVYVEAF